MSLFEEKHIYKVSELTRTIKTVLEGSFLSDIWVEGEVSGLSRPFSGHIYFRLKDEDSQIDCVIYRSVAESLRFLPENGISIILKGEINVYEPRGTYQIVVHRIEPLGIGALQLAFEQLKQRLYEEGLFDTEHKKPIPFLPKKIGVITSATGAAIRDILTIIKRRFYNVHILIHPVSVQGEGSAEEIAQAIDNMNKIGDIDVLIVGRGGGSIEDLWSFNEEIVARSIYASKIPVISAVGHEIDWTISDFVADLRAPTPSAAAEMVVPNKADLVRTLETMKSRLYFNIDNRIGQEQSRLENCLRRMKSADVRNIISSYQQNIDFFLQRAYDIVSKKIEQNRRYILEYQSKFLYVGVPMMASNARNQINKLTQKLTDLVHQIIEGKKKEFNINVAKLDALSPLSILKRGYSLCRKVVTKEAIKGVSDVSVGDDISVMMVDGEILCNVEDVKKVDKFVFNGNRKP
ncbi:TPA: exodeoxyribonuclease VII large subunit [Candidatus Poribacteria bacterium]|nr:exodeoxyribonuclease VII large subunit [Candidatus Poribacteria bacterium]